MNAAGGPLSKVFNCIPSFINIANERRGVMVGFSQIIMVFPTKYQICQFSCIYFATLPFTVGSGLFYRIQLVEFDFPEFLHILFQVDT